jgi:protein-tyrosine-phosphatase/N-acetylglutamate synthase-like GNAT family acetyltransferase
MLAAPGVLFLCVANSARSQIAEGLARQRYGDRLRILSAGSRPTKVNPLAIETMAKVGVDLTTHSSKLVDDIDPAGIELVITLCAEEVCPAFYAPVRRLHWPIPDPATAVAGESEHMPLHRFRVARLAIEAKLELVEIALGLPPRIVIAPATPEDRAELEELLVAAGLPLEGLDDTELVIARMNGALVGAAGLERWQSFGLVRSVVVAAEHRKSRIAELLVRDRLCAARFDGLVAVYLLTTGAADYFARFGFAPVERSTLPRALEKSTQLAIPVCSTATAMKLQLADSSSTDLQLTAAVAAELAEHGTLVPLWIKHPEIRRYSIGWRMGYGEWYAWMFHHWWAELDDATRAAYRTRWVPEGEWVGWFDDVAAPDDAT